MNALLDFPPHFRLRNLAAITARVFELKANPNHGKVDQPMRKWFKSFKVYTNKFAMKYMDIGRFDIFATLGFPDADLEHLKTCLAFFLWAFSTDDRTDEGMLQSRPDDLEVGAKVMMDVVRDPLGPVPRFSNARMLQDLIHRISRTASPGAVKRFGNAVRTFTSAQIQQARNRSVSEIPSVEEFISMRRATIGAALVEAMVEYSLDLDIPDHVFEDPIFIAMSEATTDIMTWPNDLCSFNKEQLDGDYQNLVCCIMVEYHVDLQSAVDILTAMIENRVADYAALKSQLPSFGSEIDKSVAMYHQALEHFVQGTIVWYYLCPRYFSGIDSPLEADDLVVNLYVR